MRKRNRPTVVITHAIRWSYFQWFLLGLYELKQRGEINLKFRFSSPICLLAAHRYTSGAYRRLHLETYNDYNLNGYVIYPDSSRKYFSIDSADSPFLFNSELLEKSDCYFKMQCPVDLDKDYFELTKDIHIPWLDHRHRDESIKFLVRRGERKICKDFAKNKYKIKPLMIGPRRLGNTISYRNIKKNYENYMEAREVKKDKKLMCYFGNAKGPAGEKNVVAPDYDWEADIVGFYGEKISHPNEKRAKAAQIIESCGEDYDARIINSGHSDSDRVSKASLIVPLKDFCAHISKFQYNLNISGYRLSIPNRFIESFMVGTAIVTDKLSVKWYLPFDDAEVKETVEMGYMKMDDVDWDKFKDDISDLKETNPEKIISCFENKWAPKKVAEYMLREIAES